MGRHAPAIITMTLLLWVGMGCSNSRPTSPVATTVPAPKQKDDRDDPMVKEARSDTEAILNDLLAGKLDSDTSLAPVARKLKGFRSWSIETQNIDPSHDPKAVKFTGTLKGPQGEATFVAMMVKQENGKWMIGSFKGPDPK